MPAISGRETVGLLLSWCVALAPVLVPEHRHEGDPVGSGATIHRHLAAHHAEVAPRGFARLDHPDDDEHVVWLTAACLETSVYDSPWPSTFYARTAAVPADSARWFSVVLDDAAPPHGPPRSSSRPRAPPQHSRLI